MFEQKEKTYQRPTSKNKSISSLSNSSKRKIKSIGMGYETPLENIESANYVDKKCPFTGEISIRGKILKGEVKSTKMQRTIVVRMNYLQFIKKYKRYEKRH